MPYQVNYEFQKNREKVVLKPIESYKELNIESTKVKAHFSDLQKVVEQIKSKTKKDDKHPYIDQSLFDSFDAVNQSYKDGLDELCEKINEAVRVNSEEIRKTLNSDRLFQAIDTFFEVGNEFTWEQLRVIIEEGTKRYELEIPPGYEDLNGSNKKIGISAFGDLIIWKEILEYAKKSKKPIIFVSNDLKADWCYRAKSSSRIEAPREELIKEMLDYAGVEFWMYSNAQLLYFAKMYLESQIEQEQITEVSEITSQENHDNEVSCTFTWPVDGSTSIGKNPLTKNLMFAYGLDNKPIMIDWGDGSQIETYTTKQTIYHNYSAFGNYTVSIYGSLFWFCAMAIGAETPVRWTQFPKVAKISFKNPTELSRLQCVGGTLQEINLTEMGNLTQLLISHNHISELDLSALTNLTILYCSANLLSKLDVSSNKSIQKLDCSRNRLHSIDLSANGGLETLNCNFNRIKRLDISNNPMLRNIDCSGNLLSTEELDEIFRQLPHSESGKINVNNNPGTNNCDMSVAEVKGWQFI